MRQINLNNQILGDSLVEMAQFLLNQCEELGEIDSRFGDGDHGVAISKIARVILDERICWEKRSMRSNLDHIAVRLVTLGAGSSGPLFGTWFEGLAEPLKDETEIDGALWKEMLDSSRKALFGITAARIGDKTMMDALIPAVEAALQSETEDIIRITGDAAEAARKGAWNSARYPAKFGRARSYGKETIGTPDAGAMSMSYLFQGLAEAFQKRLSQKEVVT